MTTIGQDKFAVFKKECLRLQDALGLREWNLYFSLHDVRDCYAKVDCHTESRTGTVVLAKKWHDLDGEYPPTDENLKRVARHEMLHVLLHDLATLAHSRYASEAQIDEAEHKVVRILEKLEI